MAVIINLYVFLYKSICMPKVLTITEFRNNIADELENVTSNKRNHIVIKRSKGRANVVVIAEEVFSSMEETLYLLSTNANREHLEKSIDQLTKGQVHKVNGSDLWK